jgi:mediator of replication checkpoint protein 1
VSDRERLQLTAWAKGETRNAGTGRSAVGAAVTGHSKPKVKAGGGTLRAGTLATSGSESSKVQEQRRPTRAPSMLSKVSDRSDRFT